MKAHGINQHAPLCGIFAPNSAGAVNCNAFNWNKIPTKYACVFE
ncbi:MULTISPECIES: DUF6783 domain-containing protein [Lacrimispora]